MTTRQNAPLYTFRGWLVWYVNHISKPHLRKPQLSPTLSSLHLFSLNSLPCLRVQISSSLISIRFSLGRYSDLYCSYWSLFYVSHPLLHLNSWSSYFTCPALPQPCSTWSGPNLELKCVHLELRGPHDRIFPPAFFFNLWSATIFSCCKLWDFSS